MAKPPNAGFSKHFLWGASTSAHQIEGNNHNQWTVWELENAKAKAAQASFQLDDFTNWDEIKSQAIDPRNYVSGELADHYTHYKSDFKYLSAMNMNAYRFSVEWSRIEPQEGSWDPAAIAHYKDYVAELRRREIEPIMTLFHYSLPTWFADMGGFTKRSNIKYFVRFAEKIVSEIGLDVRYIITVNEPEVYVYESYLNHDYPPSENSKWHFWRSLRNLATAHHRVVKMIHGMNRQYKVSFSKNSAFYYPGDNAWLSRVSTEFMQFWNDDYIINLFIKDCDFLGVNYYFSNRVYGYRIHNPDQDLNDLHWDMHPDDIEFVLERLCRKYKLPIMITENGVADMDDKHRKWWLTETIKAMQRAMTSGVELLGYIHWSLLDNFEWAYGKWPRFGLIAVDYETKKRTPRPSALWLSKTLKKLRGL
jgi:beta-glucosidase